MGRPPWAICVACGLDAAAAAAALAWGIVAIVAAVSLRAVHWAFFREWLAGLAMAEAFVALALATGFAWTARSLWRGRGWARWPSLVVAAASVFAAVLLTVWAGQGALLVLVLVGPAAIVGLFLPAARRHLGTAPAEGPTTQ